MPANREVTSLETYGGRYVDLLAPDPATIKLEDIAVSLGHTARFAGGTTKFYSVAEHAVRVSDMVPTLWALHHDSHEFVLGDLTAPLKKVLRDAAPGLIEELANGLDWAISEALDIAAPSVRERALIKEADDTVMYREAAALKWSHGVGEHWLNDTAATPFTPLGWPPDEAVARFLTRHAELR